MELPTNANSLAFSQDGNSVFTFNNGVYQWNMTTGQNTLVFSTDEAENFAGVYFSPQYNYLMRTDIREIFTMSDGLQIPLEYPLTFVDHFSEPLFSPNEKYLVTVSSSVQVWDAASGREIFKIENNNNHARDIAFSPNSQYLAVSFGYFVRVWDVRNWQEVFRISREEPVWDMAFTPDGRHFITSGHGVGSRIDVWALEVPFLQQNFAYEEYPGEIWPVQFSPDGSYFAVGTEYELVYLHDTQNKNMEIARLEHNGQVRLLDFSPDGRYLLASAIRFQADSSTIYLWDMAQENVVFTNTHAALVENMAFSPNGDYFLTADSLYTTTTRIFSTATGKEVATLPETGFMEAFFSEDGRFLCTASFETVKVWRTGTWELLMEVAGDQAAISPDGQLLATSGPRLTSNDTVKVWQISNEEEVLKFPTDRWVHDLKFSPSGQYLAIAIGQTESGGLQVWDVLHQESVMVAARGDGVDNIAFSPDSQYIAFSNEGHQTDDLVWIWDVQNRREIARWWQSGFVSQLTFSPNGQQLLSVSGGRTIHVWEWQPRRLVAEACRRLTRNFTQQEWQRYFGNEPYSSTCPNFANP